MNADTEKVAKSTPLAELIEKNCTIGKKNLL